MDASQPSIDDHLTHEELVAQLTADEAHPHLSVCSRCLTRYEEIEVADWLSRQPPKPPPSPWRRLAVGVAVAAFGGFLVFQALWDPAPELSIPGILESYRPSQELPRSGFRALDPVATYVAGDRPRFQWTAAAGTTAYEVSIENAQGERIAGGAVTATVFQPAAPLPRGVSFTWRVKAAGAPGAEASAQFMVLDGADADTWARRELKYAGDRARLAVEAANLGLRDRALELAAQSSDSRTSVEIRRRLNW